MHLWIRASAFTVTTALTAAHAEAQSDLSGEPIRVDRAAARIDVDGELGDEGWRNAERIDTWYETNPGDNVPPKVRSVGYLAYDDRFFYAAFEFDDPDPSSIRAPLSDRDKLNWQSVLFVGYGDERELSEQHALEQTSRQFFVKISYAMQR